MDAFVRDRLEQIDGLKLQSGILKDNTHREIHDEQGGKEVHGVAHHESQREVHSDSRDGDGVDDDGEDKESPVSARQINVGPDDGLLPDAEHDVAGLEPDADQADSHPEELQKHCTARGSKTSEVKKILAAAFHSTVFEHSLNDGIFQTHV